MAVVNQQLEDDNNHGSGRSTSSVDDIARFNASKEAEMERVIRLSFESMWPMLRVNESEDDNNHGGGGSTSSIDGLARVSTLTEAEMERMVSICNRILWPKIYAEINAKQQNLLLVIKEKFGLDLLTDMTWSSRNRPGTSRSQVLQFQFLNGISTPVSTKKDIEGKDHKPLAVALVDQSSGQIVTTGAEAATEVEIVVLEGNCNDVEAENWTSDEFNNNIIREWNGKKVLQGDTFVKLNKGIVYVNKCSFTHNSTWKVQRNCRLGARSVGAVFAIRIKEAKTESFRVMDKRNLKYNKHEIPSLFDDVYRLYGINHRSDCFKRLREEKIKTVMDLRTLNAINPEKLKDILKVHRNEWKRIMDHAHKCKDDRGIYLYYNSRYDQKNGVVFNVYGHLMGLVADSQFLPRNKLSSNKKGDAEKVIVSASEHWKEVVPFNDEASLINHLQSKGLNLVIPNPHTSLITPISPTNNDLKIDIIVGVTPTPTPTAGQLSQRPKRLASEHQLSNSPKKPRDNHQKMGANSEEGSDDKEYLKYLNLTEFGIPAQKWKRVRCVLGCIFIFSKVHNRRQLLPTSDNDTLMVITASV